MKLRSVLLLASALFVVPSSPGAALEPGSEAVAANLDVEKRARAEDLVDLVRLSDQVTRLDAEVSERRSQLLELLRAGVVRIDAVEEAEEKLAESAARLGSMEERRRAVASRLLERIRRMGLLAEELARRRTRTRAYPDPVSGRWDWTINPGPRRGWMRLALDGTLVSGEYVLDGSSRGSVRGTFVGEKLSFQRIDADRGFDANFFGHLPVGQRRLTGTWEATAIAPSAGPVAGTWMATGPTEKDEGVDEHP